MKTETTITFEGDHVKAVTQGRKNIDIARLLWTGIATACQEHNCFKVLVLSHAGNPMPLLDGYAHAELFRELGLTAKYRIALVEFDDDIRESATHFAETVLFNRGLPGRLFAHEEDARKYLFEDSDA